MTTTITIDRDTCTMILDSAELTRERVRPTVDAIARRLEAALAEAGETATVVREYRTTGARDSGAEGLERIIERVLVGQADDIRAEVLVTDEQIKALSTEAAQAGDLEQVAICERALDGDVAARVICERVIAAARAMEDE